MSLDVKLPKIAGIYIIQAPSGNFYVGSSCNIHGRITRHRNLLNKGSHHSSSLQAAFDKYNGNLSVEILEKCDKDCLITREQFYIDTLNPKYNQSPVAGRIEHTPEMRRKKSDALKGRPKSAEHRAKLSAAKRGTKASPEVREAMSKRRTGVPIHTPESRAKIGATHRGKVTSRETRLKLSIAATRRFNPKQADFLDAML